MTTNKSHPNTEYADLACIAKYANDHIVLHTADRCVVGQSSQVLGKEAVLAKELELIRLTGNTLVMEVQDVMDNDYFGTVLTAYFLPISARGFSNTALLHRLDDRPMPAPRLTTASGSRSFHRSTKQQYAPQAGALPLGDQLLERPS
jgi:hypothetical protein